MYIIRVIDLTNLSNSCPFSDECKVLNNFGTKYSKGIQAGPYKNIKYGQKQLRNEMLQHEVDEIILQENKNKN